jgi:hypothetical protein
MDIQETSNGCDEQGEKRLMDQERMKGLADVN